ncbi:uncharacterized protein LOC107640519 [Arachis ipaensis]|uniref:uncharacterized protein LOC107640519 n=1 Tax=Arachis ipaensis TaxID=130454 RepID=UPI0007AF3BAB|nr:uncharacterized protein LOC107640519 [Arachis ipaensis]XP_025652326.1 uncharacterized protein LOC112748322 [Arachis hypogaea]
MHANFDVAPPEELINITSPWSFAKWGLDLLGPFPQVPGQVNYLIVGVGYFTKWIEAEPLTTITAQRSQKFLYKNIITRYGILHSITTDNGTQFTDSTFRNLVASMKSKHQFTSMEHPQANGQAEAANKVILAGFKKRLQDSKGAWAEELPQQNVVVSRYTWKMLDEVEQAFVTVLEDIWGEPPHLDTKKSLGDPSLVRTALEMAKNNDSMKAFKKARKATASQNISTRADGEGSSQVPSKPSVPSSPGPRRMIPTPRVRLVDPSQSSAAFSSPPAVPPSKRPWTVELFNMDAPDFDAIGFVDQ